MTEFSSEFIESIQHIHPANEKNTKTTLNTLVGQS